MRVGLGDHARQAPRRSTARRRRRPASSTSSSDTPGTSVGYCMARNRPAWARCHGAMASTSTPSRVTDPAEDLVAGPAHDHVGQRRLARPVGAHDRVDLAASAPSRSMPSQDLLAADAGPQALDLELDVGFAHRADLHHDVAVDDVDLVDGHRAWWPAATRARRSRARTRCRASSTRSRARPRRPRPRTARCRRGCSGRRWRRSRRRCARRTIPWPSTSNRRAAPSARVVEPRRARTSRHRRRIALRRSSLLADARPERGAEPRAPAGGATTSSKKPATISRSATCGRHAPALEVEALLLVDRPDRRGVAAAHVVVLDLEVRHRLGPCVVGQLDVAVGLEGVRAPGVLPHPDQPGVDATGSDRRPRP